MSRSHHRIYRDNIYGIKKGQVKRMALKTGKIKSQDSYVMEEILIRSKEFLTVIIGDAILIMEHARKHTVSESMVRIALERNTNLFNKKILGSPPSKKCERYEKHLKRSRKSGVRRKSSRSSSLIRRIKFYQRQHDCLYLSKTAMIYIIREIAQDFKNDTRWSSDAKRLLQYALELYIGNVLKISGHIAIHRSRNARLTTKDIQEAFAIEKL